MASTDSVNDRLARLERLEALFAGGPDTVCRTVWRDETVLNDTASVEYVEVPMADLRAAFDGDGVDGRAGDGTRAVPGPTSQPGTRTVIEWGVRDEHWDVAAGYAGRWTREEAEERQEHGGLVCEDGDCDELLWREVVITDPVPDRVGPWMLARLHPDPETDPAAEPESGESSAR